MLSVTILLITKKGKQILKKLELTGPAFYVCGHESAIGFSTDHTESRIF